MSINELTRRRFLQATAVAAGGLAAGPASYSARAASTGKPNFLFIICDQLSLDAISAYGFKDAYTPNIDRLISRGTSFMKSYSTNPVCSPARSSLFTGRMPVETGVIVNGRPIDESCINFGQWFSERGYETVYCGKWHLPGTYASEIPGFTVLPVGMAAGKGEQADMIDAHVSRSSEAYLKNRSRAKPFLMVVSLLQPHDICLFSYTMRGEHARVPEVMPYPEIADKLPALPPNHKAFPKCPGKLAPRYKAAFQKDEQWRYYLYLYARMIEMLDSDIGRVLDALEDSGQAENTVVVFTSDHGDGRGRHLRTGKWTPYEESSRVPLVVSWPGHVDEGRIDKEHLVSGLDIMSTMCDYAVIDPPSDVRGFSLRPLLERDSVTDWREFVVAEFMHKGRMVRTDRYKYVHFEGDPVEMLFDMEKDPYEMNNLYEDVKLAGVMKEHRSLLESWTAEMKPAG